MSANRVRAFSLMELEEYRGRKRTYHIAASLAEYLSSLTALDYTELQETMAQVQQLVPSNIRVYKADESFEIRINDSTKSCVSSDMPVQENRMSLQNIVHGFGDEPLLQSPSAGSMDIGYYPNTPNNHCDVYMTEDLERCFLNDFDIVDWPSWLDGEFL